MPVIGLNLSEINATRKEGPVKKEIKVNSTPQINDIKETEISAMGKKALSIDFEFNTRYEPSIADIKIKGSMLYVAPDTKKLADGWKKENKLPDDISVEILNYLFAKCLLKASLLSEDLQLPSPMPMPKVSKK